MTLDRENQFPPKLGRHALRSFKIFRIKERTNQSIPRILRRQTNGWRDLVNIMTINYNILQTRVHFQ